jgi:hypothetical protein
MGALNDGELISSPQYPKTWSKMRQLAPPQPQLLPDLLLRSDDSVMEAPGPFTNTQFATSVGIEFAKLALKESPGAGANGYAKN